MAKTLQDATALRAIAHPVRNRILGELNATGPMRAADIARELAIPANQASFHLRQLAKYGLVEEDPEAARDKRDRVWRPTADAGYDVDVSVLGDQPGGEAATRVFLRNSATWAHAAVEQAYSATRDPATQRSTIEQSVRLTKAEAGQLTAELSALLQAWTERTRGRGDDDRRTYVAHVMVLPYPDLAGPPDQG